HAGFDVTGRLPARGFLGSELGIVRHRVILARPPGGVATAATFGIPRKFLGTAAAERQNVEEARFGPSSRDGGVQGALLAEALGTRSTDNGCRCAGEAMLTVVPVAP